MPRFWRFSDGKNNYDTPMRETFVALEDQVQQFFALQEKLEGLITAAQSKTQECITEQTKIKTSITTLETKHNNELNSFKTTTNNNFTDVRNILSKTFNAASLTADGLLQLTTQGGAKYTPIGPFRAQSVPEFYQKGNWLFIRDYGQLRGVFGPMQAEAEEMPQVLITSSGDITKNNCILTAHVYYEGKELNANEIFLFGCLKWYNENDIAQSEPCLAMGATYRPTKAGVYKCILDGGQIIKQGINISVTGNLKGSNSVTLTAHYYDEDEENGGLMEYDENMVFLLGCYKWYNEADDPYKTAPLAIGANLTVKQRGAYKCILDGGSTGGTFGTYSAPVLMNMSFAQAFIDDTESGENMLLGCTNLVIVDDVTPPPVMESSGIDFGNDNIVNLDPSDINETLIDDGQTSTKI